MAQIIDLHSGKVVTESQSASPIEDADLLLLGAVGKLQTCIVIGADKDGDLFISSQSSPAEVVMMLEQAKIWLAMNADEL